MNLVTLRSPLSFPIFWLSSSREGQMGFSHDNNEGVMQGIITKNQRNPFSKILETPVPSWLGFIPTKQNLQSSQ